jgi:hypothetical protein
VVLYPNVAPFADNRFDSCDLLQRNVIHHETIKAAAVIGTPTRVPAPWLMAAALIPLLARASQIWEARLATWIKCTNTKHEVVYINLDNAVTVTRNDAADRIAERGTVISFMGGEQIYIVVNEQPEQIIRPKS